MAIVDKDRGTILGINFIDLLIGVIVVFLLFSFGSKVLVKDLTYSGDEMYSAIQAYQRLDSKGFLIEAEVEGKWIADQEEVRLRGILVRPRSGAFEFKTRDGERLWLGGSMSYLEDVAVSRMTFVPLDNYVARLNQGPASFEGYDDMLAYLEDIKARYGADHLYVSGDIALVGCDASAQEVFDRFDQLYLLRDVGKGQMREGELIYKLELAELGALESVDIKADRVVLGSVEGVYLGYREEPSMEGLHVASLEELK
ncbi:MAG: hypothetical protein GXO65_01210 [Euryarchaeota archaeon]|nr:hypothetical protein [Euryarchaeota archaeon]